MTEEEAWTQIRAWAAEERNTRHIVDTTGEKAAEVMKTFMHKVTPLRMDQMRFSVDVSFHEDRLWFSVRSYSGTGWFDGDEHGYASLSDAVEAGRPAIEAKLLERKDLAVVYSDMAKRFS